MKDLIINGKICMERCFKCGLENHAMMVASGRCAWCGYDPNKKTVPKLTQKQKRVKKGKNANNHTKN